MCLWHVVWYRGVTVEELDIDIGTELKGTSSGGRASQTDQPLTEKVTYPLIIHNVDIIFCNSLNYIMLT